MTRPEAGSPTRAEGGGPSTDGRLPRATERLSRILPAAVPGLLMLAVGLVRAGRPVLSWDEVTSAEVASRSVPQILALIPNLDAVFGFYYLLLHWWTALAGTSEVALRLPSISRWRPVSRPPPSWGGGCSPRGPA